MPDREKVIKGIQECDLNGGLIGNCPYKGILSLLKEQEAVVHCKDCKYWSAERINDYNKCRRWIKVGVKNFATTGDWFCADGESGTNNVLQGEGYQRVGRHC